MSMYHSDKCCSKLLSFDIYSFGKYTNHNIHRDIKYRMLICMYKGQLENIGPILRIQPWMYVRRSIMYKKQHFVSLNWRKDY